MATCVFADYLSLHSSLVLLPNDDDSCTGCVLSSLLTPTLPTNSTLPTDGSILETIATPDETTNVTVLPFDKILATCRDAKYPVTLTFLLPPSGPPSPLSVDTANPLPAQPRRESLADQLSGWGSRFRSMSAAADTRITSILTTQSASSTPSNSPVKRGGSTTGAVHGDDDTPESEGMEDVGMYSQDGTQFEAVSQESTVGSGE